MSIDPTFLVPVEPEAVLRITSTMPTVAMHLVAYGEDAETSIRQMCHGALPVVGQRYVWVCTGVHTEDGKIQAEFQLTPLDPA